MVKDPRHLLLELAAIKAEADVLAKKKAVVEQDLIDALKARGQATLSTTLDTGGTVKGTLVEGTRVTIDDQRLKTALTAAQWKKITKQVLDNTKLEACVAIGDIDPNVVASCSTIKDVKPYVKVSGQHSGVEVLEAAQAVSATDSAGRTKPAAKRVVRKPAKAAKPRLG